MIYGIIVAGGKSERMGAAVDKAFLNLGAQPVLSYSIQAFEACPDIDGAILVVRKDRLEAARGMVRLFGCSKIKRTVAGGATRQASVQAGLAVIPDEVTIISVHDGARPCVTPALISETIKIAKRYGSGVAAVKVTDTIKEVPKGLTVSKTLDRSKMWSAQTPQTFKRELLVDGYARAKSKGLTITDESSAVALVEKNVRLVPSSWTNIKITSPEDLAIAGAMLKV